MNRDELLDKLAMELAEWPKDLPGPNLPGLWSCHQVWRCHAVGDMEPIFEHDWIQRRAELINRPSWDDAPKWAQWLAHDSGGEWWWYEIKPLQLPGPDVWDSEGWQALACKGATPAGHNWRKTLEKRPAECEPTDEEDEAFNAMAAMATIAEQPHITDARRLDAMLAEDMVKDSVGATLDERGRRYGDFSEGSAIMQILKSEAHGTPGWQRLNYAQREAVDMILHKIGRILNGDPDYADNWHDIAGYAQLVERTLTK